MGTAMFVVVFILIVIALFRTIGERATRPLVKKIEILEAKVGQIGRGQH